MAATKMVGLRTLPIWMGVSLVCVIAALALLGIAGSRSGDDNSAREMNELLALSQKLPLQANAALSGTPGAFNALSESRTRYSTLASELGSDVQGFTGSTDLLKQTQAILSAQEAIESVQKSSLEVRALVPQDHPWFRLLPGGPAPRPSRRPGCRGGARPATSGPRR